MLTYSPRNHLNLWLLPLLLSALVACSSGPQYQQDYRPDTDFGVYRSYDWRATRSQLVPQLSDERLRRLASQALLAIGYQRDTESPDILISINVLSRLGSSRGDKSVGISVGLPVGNRGQVGLGGSKNLPSEGKQEGVLLVDIYDTRQDRLIWRGSAQGIAMRQFELGREDQLRSILEQLLGRFPPGS